jgi:hypothetical protein
MPIPTNTSKPKILIPEKVSPDGLALLKDQFEVDERKGLSPDDLKRVIGDYEALIVRSETQVTAELLGAAKKLKVVARAGVGVDNVDVVAATKHGIIVVNSPSGNINAAAEHTIARELSFSCSAYLLFLALREHFERDRTYYQFQPHCKGAKLPRKALLYLAEGHFATWTCHLEADSRKYSTLTTHSDDGRGPKHWRR